MIWRKLQMNGYAWTVEFISGLRTKRGMYGHVDPDKRRVLLDADLRKDQDMLWVTLLHEYMHIVGWEAFGTDDHDEDKVDRAGECLAQLLKPFLKKPRFK